MMTNDDFNKYMMERFEEILRLREEKAKEYSIFYAFEHFMTASNFLLSPKEAVAFYYMTKHIVSLRDAVLSGNGRKKIKEIVNDLIIYALLIEAMINEEELKKGGGK